jgi:hypothetical protein
MFHLLDESLFGFVAFRCAGQPSPHPQMPFFFDPTSQLVYVGHGTSVRALAPHTTTRSATVVQHYYGHLTDVNDLLVHQHHLLSGSTELLNHCLGTGRLRWRALLECGRRISKLAVQSDTLIVCLEDCSVLLVHAKRGTIMARTDLKGERKGGIPFIMIDLASRTAYVQGNRSINAWSILTGARSFNTNLVIGQVSPPPPPPLQVPTEACALDSSAGGHAACFLGKPQCLR